MDISMTLEAQTLPRIGPNGLEKVMYIAVRNTGGNCMTGRQARRFRAQITAQDGPGALPDLYYLLTESPGWEDLFVGHMGRFELGYFLYANEDDSVPERLTLCFAGNPGEANCPLREEDGKWCSYNLVLVVSADPLDGPETRLCVIDCERQELRLAGGNY